MNKNFNLYLMKAKAKTQIKHKTPPSFDRLRLEVVHKRPPIFVRKGLEMSHKQPPPFRRPEKLFSLTVHKTPPLFFRSAFKSDEGEKKSPSHKKPPIFGKSGFGLKSFEIIQQKIKNSGTWSATDGLSEEKDQSLALESSCEFSPGFEFARSKESFCLQSMYSLTDSGRVKIEPSVSIESAIMHLNPEIKEFDCFKQEDLNKDICNYESSEYSSTKNEEILFVPKPNFNIFSSLNQAPEIPHKKPPAFNRKLREKENIHTIESNLSASESLSPLSSVSNSSKIKIRGFEPPLDAPDHLFESPNTPTSMISDHSPEKSLKNILKFKSSFYLENSILDKSRNFSPFVSNNAFEKTFNIPMKPINCYNKPTGNFSLNFEDFDKIPEVPKMNVIEFSYPSIKKGKRGSSTTVFIQTSDLPDNIKHRVYLCLSIKQQEKESKYSLKTPLTDRELDIMAQQLAEDLINRGIAYYLLVINHNCANQAKVQ